MRVMHLTISARNLLLTALVAGTLLLAGCAGGALWRKPAAAPEPVTVNQAQEALIYYQRLEYQAARTAFVRGSYKTAAAMFGAVAEASADADLAREARYGRACALLAVSDTPDAVRAGLAAFAAWSEGLPEELGGEDPRMLAPNLKRSVEALELKTELAAEKKRRTEAERKLEAAKRQLKTRESQMAKLNKQLEELEALHQSLENKKRELIP